MISLTAVVTLVPFFVDKGTQKVDNHRQLLPVKENKSSLSHDIYITKETCSHFFMALNFSKF